MWVLQCPPTIDAVVHGTNRQPLRSSPQRLATALGINARAGFAVRANFTVGCARPLQPNRQGAQHHGHWAQQAVPVVYSNADLWRNHCAAVKDSRNPNAPDRSPRDPRGPLAPALAQVLSYNLINRMRSMSPTFETPVVERLKPLPRLSDTGSTLSQSGNARISISLAWLLVAVCSVRPKRFISVTA